MNQNDQQLVLTWIVSDSYDLVAQDGVICVLSKPDIAVQWKSV